jgi:hypothetical protein
VRAVYPYPGIAFDWVALGAGAGLLIAVLSVIAGTLHTEMGTGAVVPFPVIPGATAGQPNEVLVRLRPGADAAAARTRLQRLVPAADGGVVIGVQRPAEIVNYGSMGTAPAILSGALAAGAVSSHSRPRRRAHSRRHLAARRVTRGRGHARLRCCAPSEAWPAMMPSWPG